MKEFFIGLLGTALGVIIALSIHDYVVKKHLGSPSASANGGGAK